MMNRQIEEIAEPNDESWRNFRLYRELYDEKLAELKIKDCTNTIFSFRQLEMKPKDNFGIK